MSDLSHRQDAETMTTQGDTSAAGHGGQAAGSGTALPAIPDYEVLGRLGAGAMGEVFHARHLPSEKEVALKLMAPALMGRQDLVRRFEREIRLLSDLNHPNIAGAVGHGVCDGRIFLAMEFVKGPNLASLLKVVKVFNETDVLRIGMQIATALGYAWTKQGLIHRDIKPANLLVIPDPANQGGEIVKIIDFGLARSTDTEDLSMTMTGMVMGTPNYMSPEQIRGEKELGPQCDMYALGCTLFQLLTGRLPFEANAPGQVLAAHLKDPVPDPARLVPSITSAIRHVIMTLMAKETKQRFADYQALIAACESALRTLSMRDTSSIKLLRKPMVLSRPRQTATSAEQKTITPDPFQVETSRLRRREKGAVESADYKPSTDKHPQVAQPAAPVDTTSRRARPGSATEALAKAATDKHRRGQGTASNEKSTGAHRKGTGSQARRSGATTNPTVEPAEPIAIPRLPAREIGPIPGEEGHRPERHITAWVMVGLAVIGLIAALIFRPGG